MNRSILVIALCSAVVCVGACAKKGPMERAGAKLDETVRTIKNGGEKTPSDKIKDAAQDVQDDVQKAVDDTKK